MNHHRQFVALVLLTFAGPGARAALAGPGLSSPLDPYKEAVLCFKGGKDPRQGVMLLETAARSKHPEAAYQLALCLSRGIGTEEDPARALQWLLTSAQEGHPWAAYEAGVWFTKGIGTEPDFLRAEVLLEQAVTGGLAEAGWYLLRMYKDGLLKPGGDRILDVFQRIPGGRDLPPPIPIWKAE